MTQRTYTIGDVARLSGLSVRRLRFYADQGLLPPAGRTESGYRVFTDADLVRIDLIRALRDAGVALATIRKVLSESMPLHQVLTLRLAEIEAQIGSQRRIAAALRAALQSPNPSNDELRRIWTMANLSQTECRKAIGHFLTKVTDGTQIGEDWKGWMLKMSAPDLPDDPTPEQIDAWIELSRLLDDPTFIKQMRENAKDTLPRSLDPEKFQKVQDSILPKARDAMARGLELSSDIGRAIADEYLAGWAYALGIPADEKYRALMRRKYLQHHGNTKRYWQLVRILGGYTVPNPEPPKPEWLWIGEAAKSRLADS